MILMDGPLKDTRVKHAELLADRYWVFPEYQRCNKADCLTAHWIQHEYTRGGWWIRSFSILDFIPTPVPERDRLIAELRDECKHVEESTEYLLREVIGYLEGLD